MPPTKPVVLSSASARSALRSPQGSKKKGVSGGYINIPQTPPPSNCSAATQPIDPHTTLLDQVGELSKEQKKALLARLSLELHDSAKDSARDLDMWAHAIYQALCKATPAHGYGELLVRKQLAVPAHWAHVRDFMEASEFATCSVAERQGIYHLLADLLLRYTRRICTRQGLPLTLKMIASCSANVGATFESEFPGYLASGLGKVIVRQMLAQKSS